MKKELDDKLVHTFPIIYRDRYGDMKNTCMVWGFPEDGWFNIIWNMSEKLEAIAKTQPKPKDGEKDCRLKAVQIKEKFGSLRAYFDYSSPEIDTIIDEAEEKSSKTCETCGKDGSIRGASWMRTLCDEHYEEMYKKPDGN